ncbi:chorismate synthase [bacterium]|nr:chorismate synthase [bacterium]
MGNSIGKILRITTFGESHGPAIGAVVDGLPGNIPIDIEKLQSYVSRRRPGRRYTSPRQEPDNLEILSGLYRGKTLGTPIALITRNIDSNADEYKNISSAFRPSHGDYTWQMKYKHRDPRGGGRSSGRETVARVMAAGLAEQFLDYWAEVNQRPPIQVLSWLEQIGPIKIDYTPELWQKYLKGLKREEIDEDPCRCPHLSTSKNMIDYLRQLQEEKDSAGSSAVWLVRNVPCGWGEPVFDKLNSRLAKAIISIPAAKGVEFGEGFHFANMRGSQANDLPYMEGNQVNFRSNHSGGIWGGISNGEYLWGRVVFKPTPSIGQSQKTVNIYGQDIPLIIDGRHDPCLGIRASVVVEAMITIVLADCVLNNSTATISN